MPCVMAGSCFATVRMGRRSRWDTRSSAIEVWPQIGAQAFDSAKSREELRRLRPVEDKPHPPSVGRLHDRSRSGLYTVRRRGAQDFFVWTNRSVGCLARQPPPCSVKRQAGLRHAETKGCGPLGMLDELDQGLIAA